MPITHAVVPFRRGEKVKAATDLRGVPEGTAGKVAVVNGFTWTRYWVQFENGAALGSIDHGDLVKAKEWEAFLRDRAAAELTAAIAPDQVDAPAADAPDSAGGGDGATVNGVLVPQLLLDRSAAARARLGG